jgi:glycosyltransferase involved in cell wall biosynthesis
MNCFNGETFLKEAIDSVYSQTYPNWEIIFWDNCSSDRTQEIASCYDERLVYYRAPETTPLGIARVLASGKATGRFMAFLDSDDIWCVNKLSLQIEKFLTSDLDLGIVYGRADAIYQLENGRRKLLHKGRQLPEGYIFGELVKENFIVFSSAVVDRNKFEKCGGFPSHFKNSTDYWIFLSLANKYPVALIDEVCCSYRVHSNNLSSGFSVLQVTESIAAISRFESSPEIIEGLKHQHLQLGLMYLKGWSVLKAILVIHSASRWSLLFRWAYFRLFPH